MLKRHKRKRPKPPRWTPLTIPRILEWADEYHRQTGRWPVVKSRNIGLPRGEKWSLLDTNLRLGQRDLPKGWSLAKLLAAHRGKRNMRDLPSLTIEQILAWADAHRARTGKWPNVKSGSIPEAPVADENWVTIETSLRVGSRGLPGGSSVAKLLHAHRGVRNVWELPRLTISQVLRWADEYFREHGTWPNTTSGAIVSSPNPDLTWSGLEVNLSLGRRGLPMGLSLARLLEKHRGVRNPFTAPRLTTERILMWADAYHAWHGKWPTQKSGRDSLPEGEAWNLIEQYLRNGIRGLPGGSSLARLLAEHRQARNPKSLSRLSEAEILRWADAWFQRTGKWPSRVSGAIPESLSSGDQWRHISTALRCGLRGLKGGSSLAELLYKKRGVPRHRGRQPKSAVASH